MIWNILRFGNVLCRKHEVYITILIRNCIVKRALPDAELFLCVVSGKAAQLRRKIPVCFSEKVIIFGWSFDKTQFFSKGGKYQWITKTKR